MFLGCMQHQNISPKWELREAVVSATSLFKKFPKKKNKKYWKIYISYIKHIIILNMHTFIYNLRVYELPAWFAAWVKLKC